MSIKLYHYNFLIRIITIGPILFIPTVIGIVMLFVYNTHQDSLHTSVETLKQQRIDKYNTSIKSRVDGVVDLINYQNSIIIEKLENKIKDRVESAYKIAKSIHDKFKDKKSEAEIKSIIVATLRPLLWNKGESFIWILDYDGVFHLAPEYLRHKEGSSIIDFQDSTGRYIIKEEIDLCKKEGSGFIWDTFTKPNGNSNKQYKQLAFVKAFGEYGWYFGSGEYLDTANKISHNEVLNSISKISAVGGEYVFVTTMQGVALLNKTVPRELIGKNISEHDSSTNIKSFKKIINALKETDRKLISYTWLNPVTQVEEKKYSYVRKVHGTDWFVGSGYYETKLNNQITKEIEKLYDNYNIKTKSLVLLSVIMTFASLLASFYISILLRKSFQGYENKVREKEIELLHLNKSLEEKVAKRTESLEKLATTDSLTGCYNRYAIMRNIEAEINRSKRSSHPLSIIMYDFDHFKLINDTYGHDVGDKVLIETTKVINENIREVDIIGRYGGEEFLILMPDTKIEEAVETAHRVRTAVASHDFKHIDGVTISLGVVEYHKGDTVSDFLIKVDDLLYESKKNGRNKVSTLQ